MELIKATKDDIPELIGLRIAYLLDDYGELDEETITTIKNQLPPYFEKHLGNDLLVYIAKDKRIVSCVFLLITEKPANPSFPRGRTGTLLNVYTVPEARQQGLAKKLMELMLDDARELELDFVELKSTPMGASLYKSLGFTENHSGYIPMKLEL